MHNEESVVYDTGGVDITELHDADGNHNANKEREGQTCADRNSNAVEQLRTKQQKNNNNNKESSKLAH